MSLSASKAVQQSQVMDDSAQFLMSEGVAAEMYNEGFAAMSVNV